MGTSSHRALHPFHSFDRQAALKAAEEALDLFNRATVNFETAYDHAKKKVDENSQPTPLTKEDIKNLF